MIRTFCHSNLHANLYVLILSPNHLVHNTNIALDNLYYLGRNILLYIIWYRDAELAVLVEFYSCIYSLKETLLVDTCNDEIALVDCLWALGRSTDADSREWMTYTGEERRLLWKGSAIRYYRKGIHLKTIVIVEAERFMLDYSLIQFKA